MLEFIRKSAESWGVKLLFGLIIIVFVFWGVGSYQGNKTQVVAYVNERPILVQDYSRIVERELQSARSRNPGASMDDIDARQVRQQVLSTMVNNELLHEEAARLHITASVEEIAEYVRSIPSFYNEQGQFDTQRYRAILAQQGLRPADFEGDVRQAIISSKMRELATLPAKVEESEVRSLFDYSSEQRSIDYILVAAEAFKGDVDPSDEQVQAYYEEHKDDYRLPERLKLAYFDFSPQALADKVEVADAEIQAVYNANKSSYMGEEKIKARHILLMTPDEATPEKEAEIRGKVEDLARQAREGADFAELATEFSDDLTKDQGGDLGWVGRGEMVEAFEETLFATEPGSISEPVRTPYGWHVIKVEERKEAQQKPLEEVEAEIRENLQQAKAADTLTDLLDQALEQVISGVSMKEIADTLDLELRTTDLVSQGEAKAELGLEDTALQALFAMESGFVTDTPLATDSGYMLAEVLERKPSEIQPLDTVREQVVEAVIMDMALENAKAEAPQLVEAVNKDGLPQEDKEKLQQSSLFGRQGFFQELGMNPPLATAAFAAAQGQWLDTPFATSEGYVVARVANIAPPSDEQWQQSKDRLLQMMGEGRKNELYYAYIENLRRMAEIEVVNPQFVQ